MEAWPRKWKFRIWVIASALFVLVGTARFLFAQDKSQFPDGFDAVEAAPNSHKVILENAFLRWPSIFLNLDGGGRTAHQRY
jgi:hypothetical protein